MTILIDINPNFPDRIEIKSDQEFRDKELIKAVPGSSYDNKEHRWFAPLTWAACRQLRGIFGDRLASGEALAAWSWEEYRSRVEPALGLRVAWDAEGDADLYPFQRAGVQFLTFARRALLCDEMGTGKTVQTIRTLANLTRNGEVPFPAIVVCPNNMTLTWKKEFERWWPGIVVSVIKGTAKQCAAEIARTDVHVWVINYEKLRLYSRLAAYGGIALKHCHVCEPLLPDTAQYAQSKCERCDKPLNKIAWKTVIVDEAHRLKDPRAKQTRGCWALRTPETEFVFALTGTAIANTPVDLWPALHLISKNEWPSRVDYIDRYCLTAVSAFGPVTVFGLREEMKPEFFDIVDPRMRRMPKEAVLPHLPKKTYSERYVEMSPKQKSAYKQMADGLIAMLDSGIAVAGNPLVQMTRMSQFASAYATIDEEGEVRLSEPSCKLDALMDVLDDMGEEPAVVFAQHAQLIRLAAARLDKAGIPYSLIIGEQSVDEREWAKEQFQNGQVRVILCTIAAGGIGITLTRSATAIFLQRSWSMIDNAQAEDRVHRIGSEIHDKIEIVDIIAADTLEERQRVILGIKEERLEEVMRDKVTLRSLLVGKGEL